MRRPTNGHTSARTYRHASLSDEDPGATRAFPVTPFAELTAAHGFLYATLPLLGIALFAWLWAHYASKGARK